MERVRAKVQRVIGGSYRSLEHQADQTEGLENGGDDGGRTYDFHR